MARVILSINVTLDGCFDHTEVIADDELHRYATDLLDDSDGVLFGRVTYELFERYWPAVSRTGSGAAAEVAFARTLNNKRKYVVSRTLDRVQWENSFLIKGDLAREVANLKDETSSDLVVFGSPGLASALARLFLIDEYQFLVQPILAGRGPTLFQGLGGRLHLKLVGTRRFNSGVVLHRYAPVRSERK